MSGSPDYSCLRFLGANYKAVMAAMHAYWGPEDLPTVARQQREVRDFARALHAAVQSVLDDEQEATSAQAEARLHRTPGKVVFTYPCGLREGDRVRLLPGESRRFNAHIMIPPGVEGVVVPPPFGNGHPWPEGAVQVHTDEGGRGAWDANLLELVERLPKDQTKEHAETIKQQAETIERLKIQLFNYKFYRDAMAPLEEEVQALLNQHRRPGLGSPYLRLLIDWVQELLADQEKTRTCAPQQRSDLLLAVVRSLRSHSEYELADRVENLPTPDSTTAAAIRSLRAHGEHELAARLEAL